MRTPSSTKIAISVSVGLIIISFAFAFSKKNEITPSRTTNLGDAVKLAITKSLGDDIDGDGLKNWEEALYKTDPNKADSDEDGVSDGEEVKNHADPAVPGTGSDFQTIEDLAPYATTSTKKLTATDKFSQSIISKYLEAKQAGKTIDESTITDITDSVIYSDFTPSRLEFVMSSALITKDNSAASFKLYGNTFGKIISTPPLKGIPHETDIIKEIDSEGLSAENKKNLEAISARYKVMRTGLVQTTVPSQIAKSHEMFIRGLDRIMDGVNSAINFDTDPVGAYIAINGYGDGVDIMTTGILDMKALFLKAGVTFSPQEAGRLITE